MVSGRQRQRLIELATFSATVAGVAAIGLAATLDFIPIVNNVLFVGGWMVMLVAGIRSFKIAARMARRARWRTLAAIELGFAVAGFVCLVIAGALAVLLGIRDDGSFSIQGRAYYVGNEGFFKMECVVYEQDGPITMREIQRYPDRSAPYSIDDEVARELVDGTYGVPAAAAPREEGSGPMGSSMPAPAGAHAIRAQQQHLLDERFSADDVISVGDSGYGLVAADKAAARTRWLFVRVEGARPIFISELVETAGFVSGSQDADGVLTLTFQDAGGDPMRWRSTNSGRQWSRVASE